MYDWNLVGFFGDVKRRLDGDILMQQAHGLKQKIHFQSGGNATSPPAGLMPLTQLAVSEVDKKKRWKSNTNVFFTGPVLAILVSWAK